VTSGSNNFNDLTYAIMLFIIYCMLKHILRN